MRRVNPQWVFLIILTLWIPVLCFADESESMPLAENIIAEKIENMNRMQGIREITQARMHERNQIEAAQAEVDAEPWLPFVIYKWGLLIAGILGAVFAVGGTVVMIWKSMRFNYYLYVEYGEFAYAKTDSSSESNRREEVAKKYNFDFKDVDDYAWFVALGYSALACVVLTIMVFLWPIALIVLGPELFTMAIAYRKRKKMVFEKKLKGEDVGTV